MKYLLEWWIKEPIEENMKKGYEIEDERRKKGTLINEIIFPVHFTLNDPHGLMIIEDDEKLSRIAKWLKDYFPVYNTKFTPMILRGEFEKL